MSKQTILADADRVRAIPGVTPDEVVALIAASRGVPEEAVREVLEAATEPDPA